MAGPSKMDAQLEKAYSTGVLDPNVHARLIRGIDKWAEIAGIAPSDIVQSSAGKLAPYDQTIALNIREAQSRGRSGYVMTSTKAAGFPMMSRVNAMAGVFIRNFIDARVVPVRTLLQDALAYGAVDVLMIPNLVVRRTQGAAYAGHEIATLHDLLVTRHNRGLYTVVVAPQVSRIGLTLGDGMRELVTLHYDYLPDEAG